MIELNKKKLLPEKVVDTLLTNIKNSKKIIYAQNFKQYLEQARDIRALVGSKKSDNYEWDLI